VFAKAHPPALAAQHPSPPPSQPAAFQVIYQRNTSPEQQVAAPAADDERWKQKLALVKALQDIGALSGAKQVAAEVSANAPAKQLRDEALRLLVRLASSGDA